MAEGWGDRWVPRPACYLSDPRRRLAAYGRGELSLIFVGAGWTHPRSACYLPDHRRRRAAYGRGKANTDFCGSWVDRWVPRSACYLPDHRRRRAAYGRGKATRHPPDHRWPSRTYGRGVAILADGLLVRRLSAYPPDPRRHLPTYGRGAAHCGLGLRWAQRLTRRLGEDHLYEWVYCIGEYSPPMTHSLLPMGTIG